jgi:class 3 adenylate cyclase
MKPALFNASKPTAAISFDPEVKRHHGRIFKLMGDGLLAEFGNVVDAKPLAVQAPVQVMR